MVYNSSSVKQDNLKTISCRPYPKATVKTVQALDGSWHRETVGDTAEAGKAVVLAVGSTARQYIMDAYADGSLITLEVDSMQYTGFISELPTDECIKRGNTINRKYKIEFDLNITSKAEV